VGTGFSNPVTHAGMTVAILGYMVVVQPIVALVSMVLLVPQLALTPILQRRVNALVERRVPLMRELGDRVAEGGDRIDPGEMGPHLDRVFANRMAIHGVKFLLKGLINLANHLAPLAVLVVGGWFVLEGRTTIGVVVAFVSGFERLGDPLRELVSWYRTASRTRIQHALIARWMTGG
ncbi:MAG: ABC transporter ATP-binding protein, partial [Alphaproteobacteria bacterium]|nr:ABC transporter ATP-binding protein [Alphaproteobacteria bacterium]